MEYILKTADYVNKFRCLGGECELTCCKGWNIIWLKSEYERLINADCSEQLRKIINEAFKFNEEDDSYSIKPCDDGDCLLHDKNDGLCMVQKELGAEYLSLTCQSYPTYGTINNHVLTETRYLNCPAVFDIIAEEERACDYYLCNCRKTVHATHYLIDTVKNVNNNPALKHRNELFDFFYGIMSDKKTDIKTSLMICTLAAQKLSEFEKKSPEKLPEIAKTLLKQSHSPSLKAYFNDIKPNYKFKFKTVNVAFNFLCSTAFDDSKKLNELHSSLYNGNDIDVDFYSAAVEKFYNAFSHKKFLMKNVIRTLYTNNCFPFKNSDYTIFENFAFFALVVGLIEHMGACAAIDCDDNEKIIERFKYALSVAARQISNSKFFFEQSIEYLKSNNLLSLGNIVLLIK